MRENSGVSVKLPALTVAAAGYQQFLSLLYDLKRLYYIARVATNVLNTIHYVFGNEEIEH